MSQTRDSAEKMWKERVQAGGGDSRRALGTRKSELQLSMNHCV